MADCPRCKSEIGSSQYCGCGWKARKRPADNAQDYHANAHIDCGFEPCNISAIHKIHTKIGWVKCCQKHYDRYYSDEAHANLDKWGMAKLADETTVEHNARMRKFVSGAKKRFEQRRYEEAA